MKIESKPIDAKYLNVKITEDNTTIDCGTLSDKERKELSTYLRDVADEIDHWKLISDKD